jgi:hypothetical protein
VTYFTALVSADVALVDVISQLTGHYLLIALKPELLLVEALLFLLQTIAPFHISRFSGLHDPVDASSKLDAAEFSKVLWMDVLWAVQLFTA